MFQFKVLHRILLPIKESDLCDYCGLVSESIMHICCECDIASFEYFTDIQIILGDPGFD